MKTYPIYSSVEIPQTPLEEAFTMYKFINNDLREGLNYDVSEELINRNLEAIENILKEPLDKVDNGLSAKEYVEMLYPLLLKVQAESIK